MTTLRIATRNSKLALWQANEVKRLLLAQNAELEIELVEITSDGDIQQTPGFDHFGYKGVFTKRIEAALLDERADIAVHSMKDMHSELPDTLAIGAVLEREDPRDAFLSEQYENLAAMPPRSVVGTASVRRQAIIKHLRPDLEVVPFRGNVPTRLEKLQRGDVDATILAVAGLKRLKLDHHIKAIFSPDTMLPAVAQGAVGIEYRIADQEIGALLNAISHPKTMLAIRAERALLAEIDGDCKTPLCGYAVIDQNHVKLEAKWFEPDGSGFYSSTISGTIEEVESLGKHVGKELKSAKEAGPS